MRIIDVNAGAGFWPIQAFTDRSLVEQESTFASLSIDEVWLSAIESILFPEPDTHDRALFEQLDQFPRFRPVKTINPLLANWQNGLLSAKKQFPLAALKLFPNYHGYSPQSPLMAQVGALARELSLPILIQMRVNDERNQPSFLQVRGVDAAEIAQFSRKFPDQPIIALNAYGGEVAKLADGSPNLLIDFSFLDGCDTFAIFEGILPMNRFIFGSHAPFLLARAARMKLDHFELSDSDRSLVASENLLSRLK
jgi:predicted TIM-barrel fold metal-dependent hydrolase